MTKQHIGAAAIVTIVDGHRMTRVGRSEIARWLEHQAAFLRTYGRTYGSVFRARYYYRKSGR